MVSDQVRWTGVAFVVFGLAGLMLSSAMGPRIGYDNPLTLAVPIAASVTGAVMWFVLVERKNEPTVKTGLLAGGITGLLAHIPLYVVIAALVPYLTFEQQLWVIPFSMIIGGLITIPLGAVTGWLLARWRIE